MSRRRRFSLWPLVGLSVLLFLVPAGWSQRARLAALAAFIPFRSAAQAALRLPSSGEAATLRTENDFLKDQVQRQADEIARLKGRLEAVSGLRQQVRDLPLKLLHADVLLPTDGSPWRKSLTLALGTGGGVRKGMLVLYNNQLVGRVLEAGPWTSRVQVATDPGFRAGAVAVPRQYTEGLTLDKRHVGLYLGTAGEHGRLKWFLGDLAVGADALVVTTEDPLNGIPRGLILGRVSKQKITAGMPVVDVEPIVNYRALEHVMLVVPPESAE